MGWNRLNPQGSHDCYYKSFGNLYHWSFPTVALLGSSHITHLERMKNDKELPQRTRDFLANCHFLGVGGLCWWKTVNELNGIFTTESKRKKYGNVWADFDKSNKSPSFYVIVLGSNDTSDLDCRLRFLKANLNAKDYAKEADLEVAEWFESLKPFIKYLISEIRYRSKTAKILYMPILPRKRWLEESRRFAFRLDEYICLTLKDEIDDRIKCLPTKSLLCVYASNPDLDDSREDVVASYLDDDCVHLNHWGYEAMINDFCITIADMWGSMVGGQSWSERAIKRKAESALWSETKCIKY